MKMLVVNLFGKIAIDAGTRKVVIGLTLDQDELTFGELKKAVAEKLPKIAPMIPYCYLAIDRQIEVRDNRYKIKPGAEITLIGQTAGG